MPTSPQAWRLKSNRRWPTSALGKAFKSIGAKATDRKGPTLEVRHPTHPCMMPSRKRLWPRRKACQGPPKNSAPDQALACAATKLDWPASGAGQPATRMASRAAAMLGWPNREHERRSLPLEDGDAMVMLGLPDVGHEFLSGRCTNYAAGGGCV